MKKTEQNRFIILLLVIIFAVIISLLVFFLKKNYDSVPTFGYSETKEVRNCTGYGVCSLNDPSEFHMLSLNYDNEDIQKEIEKINKNSLKYYNRQKNSTVDDNSTCDNEAKKTYYHSLEIYSIIDKVIDDKYIGCSVIRLVRDVCTNEEEKVEPDILIFDKSKNKLISEEDLLENENISQEQIKRAINKTLDYLSSGNTDGITYSYDDVDQDSLRFYYGSDGKVHVIFYHNVFKSYNTGAIE